MTRHTPVIVGQISGDIQRALTTLLKLSYGIVPTRDDLVRSKHELKRLVARARHIRFKDFIAREPPARIANGDLFAGVCRRTVSGGLDHIVSAQLRFLRLDIV